MTLREDLRKQSEIGAARALGQQDWDPYSPTRGCFDRRFWAWKLVDYSEATFQRHVYPLAILYNDPSSRFHQDAAVVDAIMTGLKYTATIQHRNGSFDQAFPFEQSWGATAFLVHPLLEAFHVVRAPLGREADAVASCLQQAATFLCGQHERHGRITNHLAGGALSLLAASRVFNDSRFATRAAELVDDIIKTQSPEGWFPEYGGADPGYQTLCLYYLAEIERLAPAAELTAALARALEFLRWFVHPDGTLGGLYGSRRTSVVYVGGFALLADRSPLAATMLHRLATPIVAGRAMSPATIDAGNLAPLLTNVARAVQVDWPTDPSATLPCQEGAAVCTFPQAGLHVCVKPKYYAVFGAANGGTLTVFDRASATLVRDDGGYVGKLVGGGLITTQNTEPRSLEAEGDTVTVEAAFCRLSPERPTPGSLLMLRILNLTVMRSTVAGNFIKRLIVRRLITGRVAVDARLRRRVAFRDDAIVVEDHIESRSRLSLEWLECGRPFSAIHMASAGYYDERRGASRMAGATPADVTSLRRSGRVEVRIES